MTSPKPAIQIGAGHASPRPRIGIDLHVVDDLFQGSRTHCLELFSRVIALTPECDFVVLAGDTEKLLSFSQSFALRHVTLLSMPKKRAAVRLLWQLPQIVRQCGVSLLHTQYIVPPIGFCATAVTVHDILFESHREYYEAPVILRNRLLVPFSVRRSPLVFTVSEFSRRQICDCYSVPAEKVHTIPNGVDCERFFPGDQGIAALRALGIREADYFLTVGRLEPRKNYAALLRAWAQSRVPRPQLVIVGQRHFRFQEIFDLIRALRLEPDVLVVEEASDKQLPAIYRNAKGFVFCSSAEGFGMPLLEAMASGIPVISSANTALTEVSADAALRVDPNNPGEIENAILALKQQANLRETLIHRGLQRTKEFTWEKPAHTVRGVYLRHFGLLPLDEPVESLGSVPKEPVRRHRLVR
jgi:glycosyltransferase involved in cell wall biosynthesis